MSVHMLLMQSLMHSSLPALMLLLLSVLLGCMLSAPCLGRTAVSSQLLIGHMRVCGLPGGARLRRPGRKLPVLGCWIYVLIPLGVVRHRQVVVIDMVKGLLLCPASMVLLRHALRRGLSCAPLLYERLNIELAIVTASSCISL